MSYAQFVGVRRNALGELGVTFLGPGAVANQTTAPSPSGAVAAVVQQSIPSPAFPAIAPMIEQYAGPEAVVAPQTIVNTVTVPKMQQVLQPMTQQAVSAPSGMSPLLLGALAAAAIFLFKGR